MAIAIYRRDLDTGTITYVARQKWDHAEQYIEYFNLPETGTDEAVVGWPHPVVRWHGHAGFGRAE